MRSIVAGLGLGVALLVAPTAAMGQVAFKAGVSFASATESDYLPEVKTRTGFALGVGLAVPVGPTAAFRVEGLYVQKGGTLANDGAFRLDEFNVPLMLELRAPVPVFAPFVLLGPQAEYELSCTKLDVDCVETSTLRWGFVAGAGVKVGGSLSVEGRYAWTMSALGEAIPSKPRTIMVMLGIGGG